MWGLFCYRWSYGAYPNFFCHILPPGRDQFLLAVVQAEARRRQLCPDHVGRVQGIPLPQSRWLTSLCRHLLGKDQKGLPAPARGNPRLGSPLGALASGLLRLWPRYNSEQGDYDPIIPGRPDTFHPGIVGGPRPRTGLLRRGCWENRQCKGKGVTTIVLQYPRDGLKISLREQARKKGGHQKD